MLLLETSYVKARPMITVKLGKTQKESRFFELLIDSGSDYTIIPKSDAQILGIDYKSLDSEEIKIEMANLTYIMAKESKLDIAIGTEHFTVPVLITKCEVDRLLGRKGIFNRYEITFKESQSIVSFKRI